MQYSVALHLHSECTHHNCLLPSLSRQAGVVFNGRKSCSSGLSCIQFRISEKWNAASLLETDIWSERKPFFVKIGWVAASNGGVLSVTSSACAGDAGGVAAFSSSLGERSGADPLPLDVLLVTFIPCLDLSVNCLNAPMFHHKTLNGGSGRQLGR